MAESVCPVLSPSPPDLQVSAFYLAVLFAQLVTEAVVGGEHGRPITMQVVPELFEY